MKDRFSENLADIQAQLNKHSEDRLAQAKENEALRENLAKLLKFDGVRAEHFDTQLKTKVRQRQPTHAAHVQCAFFSGVGVE